MEPVTLFLCGDVMTGRGIDQVLATPSDPTLYEPWIEDARDYVRLAEERHGPLSAPVPPDYPWGEALAELDRAAPAARIVNLETAVTTYDAPWPGKGIHYRMHPANVPVLTVAGIDCCVLANNHVADWGLPGLEETLDVLHGAGMQTAGAGRDLPEAERPAVLDLEGGHRVLVLAMGSVTSGIPEAWRASPERPGLFVLPEPPDAVVPHVTEVLDRVRRPGDVVVASIHWGGNWDYRVPSEQQALARRLIDEAGVSVGRPRRRPGSEPACRPGRRSGPRRGSGRAPHGENGAGGVFGGDHVAERHAFLGGGTCQDGSSQDVAERGPDGVGPEPGGAPHLVVFGRPSVDRRTCRLS